MAGCRSKYQTHIQPFFDKIDELLNDGASEEQVAVSLGISYASWNNYKRQYPEFDELCRKPRKTLIQKLRSALVERALGFEYEEKKTYYRKPRGGSDDEVEYIYTEVYKKRALPDTTAIFGALNIYDPDYVKDKKQYELKQIELELRKQIAENKDW